ncbi:MAG: hypothetical protein JWN54_1524 [Mycobacterium sp.]|nr:hypothetical protein [Mycobacterium sp.]
MYSRFRRTAAVAGALAVLGMSACVGEGSAAPRPSSSLSPSLPPAPSPSSSAPRSVTATPSGTAEEQVLALYRRYWTTVLPAAAAVPRAERRALLEPLMVEPALSGALALLLSIDRAGQRLYGHAVPVSQVVQWRDGAAVLRGCINSYEMGRIDVDTGKFVSRGRPREAVLMAFQIGDDGAWRVSAMYFPKDPRC